MNRNIWVKCIKNKKKITGKSTIKWVSMNSVLYATIYHANAIYEENIK